MLDCAILPTCRNDLILSGHFLRITKTLTKFKSRLKESLRHSLGTRLRLNLVGGERHRFWGKLNDEHTLALPDTGSDVMLMSTWWAECNNFNISKDPGHQLELELADGSTVFTSGIVRDATWSFGYSTRTIRSDFYLLDDLDVNVVFSNDFIFELDIYSEFAEFMLQLDPKPGLSDLCNIRLIIQSPDARKAERVRRDRIRDEINALDPEKRNEAWDKEHQRRLIWDRHRERHENETWIAAVNQQKLANAKACWWKRTFRRG
ncbi:hypothetical protein N0V84_003640 [Fusarium piperis]|uniref:Uncharacterized protein n=1 Tax=Fusarium piperis TaxID=1435070 RepID=A0A9W9BS98_9HYPO|nr:hypothetical protein N0V84_003640 [Fusarium piperis]